jgi:hypothetical protein
MLINISYSQYNARAFIYFTTQNREEVSSYFACTPAPKATVHVHVHIRVRSRDRTEAVACSHPIRRCKDINRAETQLRTPIRRETQLKPHFGYKKRRLTPKGPKGRKKNVDHSSQPNQVQRIASLARGHRPAARFLTGGRRRSRIC